MGGGILPVAYHGNKIKFLFSREALHNKDHPGMWSDFGGSKERSETPYQTAIREGWEESAGFLGNKEQIKNLIKSHKVARISNGTYTTYLVEIPYDPTLPKKFATYFKKIKKARPDLIYKSNGLFEKDKLMWLPYSKLRQNLSRFRPWYREILRLIIKECKE